MPDRTAESGFADVQDPILAGLIAHPVTVRIPPVQSVSLLFSSPHSGRLYPQTFVAGSWLSALNLRRSEDAYVDLLFAPAAGIGASLVAARFPRAFLDVNRAPSELDPDMFDAPLEVPADPASPRVHAGLGVIPRIIRDGAEIYRHKLDPRIAAERIAAFHRPYHAAIAKQVELLRRRFGFAVLLDCHSMPSTAASHDMILGDRHGLSAAPAMVRAMERAFLGQGFSVARNIPYPGGYTTQLHGRPATGVHALQIEVNRATYLDEDRVAPGPQFRKVQIRIASAIAEFVGAIGAAGQGAAAQAAE